jgi:hypothetical protein
MPVNVPIQEGPEPRDWKDCLGHNGGNATMQRKLNLTLTLTLALAAGLVGGMVSHYLTPPLVFASSPVGGKINVE